MRRFNNKEKRILKGLARGDRHQHFNRYLPNCFLNGEKGIAIDYENSRLYAAMPPNEDTFKELEDLWHWQEEIIDLLLLIKLLLEEKYIVSSPHNKYQNNKLMNVLLRQNTFTRLINEEHKESFKANIHPISIDEEVILFVRRETEKLSNQQEYEHVMLMNEHGNFRFRTLEIPQEFFGFIEDNLLGTFHITEDLIDYVNNNFRSREEIRHSRNVRLTWISIAVALFIGLSAMILQIKSSEQANKYLDTLQKEILKINESLDEIKKKFHYKPIMFDSSNSVIRI